MNVRQLLERSDRPFASHPQVGRFYASAPMEDARRRLGRAIERGDGLGVVIGGAGTGKSLLLQVLAAEHHGQFDVVLLACAQLCTRRALLQAILFELGLEYRCRDEGELRLSLLDQLLSNERDSTGLLLLVDEAQLLPPRLLEELRMLTNVVQGGVPRVRLVLAGMPALEEMLASPELESFSQRVVARCYLAPFTRDETIQYGRAQIAASGGEPDRWFAPEAWHAVFEATDGVPRLVNQLCSRALWLADAQQSTQVDRAIVQAAWSDLQQLPTPWEATSSRPKSEVAGDVVEFGNLADENSGGVSADSDAKELDASDAWKELAAGSDWAAESIDTPTHSASAATWPDTFETKSVDDIAWGASWDTEDSAETSTHASREPQAEQSIEPHATIDPFDEHFDEEEIVLDNFATWDSAQYRRSPRVENRRDRGFTTLVQQALDASAAETSELPRGWKSQIEEASDPLDWPTDETDVQRPRVRLAVVPEPAPLRPIPVVTTPAKAGNQVAAAFEPELTNRARPDAERRTSAAQSAVQEDILIVEDDADELSHLENPGQADKFRRLLARLRGNE